MRTMASNESIRGKKSGDESMKVEDGMATTSTPLHKVKEEAKEYIGYQQSSEASSATTTATTTMTTPTTITTATTKTTTTTTTTTTSMTKTTTTTITTATTSTSLATVASIVTVPNSSTIVNGTGSVVPSLATTPPTTTTVPNASSPATTSTLHQSTGVVCHLSVPASTVLVNADPFPVDLDLKTKIKVSSAARDKVSREDAQPEVHSPCSHHQKISTAVPAIGQPKQSNGTPRADHKGTTIVVCSASSDSGSPLPSHYLKPESEDATGSAGSSGTGGGSGSVGSSGASANGSVANCRTEEQSDVPAPSNSNGSNSTTTATTSTGNRCIAGVFAGHGELKSVLGTVVKFATGISPDTGDTVLTLVLALLSGTMTAEEFHSALQEATNYSLKGFVLPHLKQQLPSLQRDLSNAARATNQSCAQFLRSNEAAVLEAVGLVTASDHVEIFGEYAGNGTASGNGGNQCPAHYGIRSNSNPGIGAIQHTNNTTPGFHHYSSGTSHAPKRRASDTPYYENGAALLEDVPVYGKRLTNPWSHHHPPQPQQQPSGDGSSPYCWYHPLHSSSGSIQGLGHRHAHGHGHSHGHGQTHGHAHGHSQGDGSSSIPTSSVQINQMNAFSGPHHLARQQQQQQISHVQTQNGSLDDEWKNIHMMLNCILGMVEKTKKALAILQTRGCFAASTPAPPLAATSTVPAQNGGSTGTTVAGNNPSSTNGSQVESSTGDREGSLKRLSGEIVAQTIRAIEDKVAEVKRKDEEAVKRAVMAEVQRAVRVAVAESRATERLRVHRMLDVPLSQRNHGSGLRQGSYLRVHGNHGAVDANARTVATTPTNSVSNSIPSISEDEKEAATQLQTVSGSSCWNCGRPALETCGGCGIARYCGSFCQHRDWEAGGHHATCNNPPPREPRRSASRSPPRIASVNEANVAAPIPASGATKGK
ncbi:CBFA2/RUNX1 partner transcriptional co-repressor nervy isoform X1 [Bombus fervidus]|uniref:CBFA2/RUNX1 partner transcriptional co-repressor nervy isoform X1 n=2 Tax=Bombus fervidus TaxID=203811 RepID=UPI003AB2F69A